MSEFGNISSGAGSFDAFKSNKSVNGTTEFLESNSLVAKVAFLLLVLIVFVIAIKFGFQLLAWLFSYSGSPYLIDGMVDVVDRGTARIAKIDGISVAGKTGTVENFILLKNEKKQLTDHSTFIAFAPAENPKIVVSVFIENGYWGSRWAAPIASLIIEKYLNENVERKWLESRMLNGSLVDEYEKPYKYKNFSINE